MNSEKYDIIILNTVQAFCRQTKKENIIWMQDGALSHISKLTQTNLRIREIVTILWPSYSLDLNLIEHV